MGINEEGTPAKLVSREPLDKALAEISRMMRPYWNYVGKRNQETAQEAGKAWGKYLKSAKIIHKQQNHVKNPIE